MLEQLAITCPYCWESIEVVIDPSVEAQRYVEDCSVCCQPILISYSVGGDGSVEIDAARESGE